MQHQQPRVVVVTGASRGAGKGIAQALGSQGDIVYVTGRSQREGDGSLPGTIYATAEEINKAGGTGIAVACDHADDEQVKALFEKIINEQGRLDILVNNAAQLHDDLVVPVPFWEKSLELVKLIDVGLRSSYVASYYAAKIMAKQKRGLIVNTSSPGAACYMHGPAYGAQKAGTDKMAWDMAIDLKPFQVAVVSIWMGVLKTERLERVVAADPDKYAGFIAMAETPQFTGLVIDALFRDPAMMSRSGQALVGAEIGLTLGVKDIDGKQPHSHRDMLGGPIAFNNAIVQ